MSRASSTALALLFLLGAALPASAAEPKAAPAETSDVIPGEVVVQFREGRGQDLARLHGMAVLAELGPAAEANPPLVVSTGGQSVDAAIAELRADPAVATVEPNYRVELADEGGTTAIVVDDPKTGDQYSLDRMRVRQAWARETGASNVIAVLDTGVQTNHPDLAGRLVAGHDFVNDDSSAADDNGHGTWVSGIIVAKANDGYGIAGLSWTDKVMPVKIMDREGTGTSADLISGIRWAADHGADVINMSVGGFPYSKLVQDAVNYAWGKGVVLVGAAGNNRREETYYPASLDNVISVSATQPQDEFSNWSSWGPKVDVSAPGSSVLTTNCYACTYADHDSWGAHTYISGTSFATPNTAGVVALIRARYPSYTPSQVVHRLRATADDLGYDGWDNRYGSGRINAYRAVGGSVSQPSVPRGDGRESNNSLSSARKITIGAVTRPSIYPAGDVDWFAVDVPRAGRIDIRVTGVVDSRAYPWNRSPIPVDPIVELFSTSGTRLVHADSQSEGGTEVARRTVGGATRILVKIWNYYANGNTATYTVKPVYVDTAAPKATISYPASGATAVSRIVKPRITFNEPVTNIGTSSIRLRDMTTNKFVPATVRLDGSKRVVTIETGRLARLRQYRVEATTAVTDIAGNHLATRTLLFTTGLGSFVDADGNKHEKAIEWILAEGITFGCSAERYCPNGLVTRGQMASFLARALDLPSTGTDYYADDEANKHESSINRVAAAGITAGCDTRRYCPDGVVTRAQMASFLARAVDLTPTGHDYFTDDNSNKHEARINAIAAADITFGCTATTYCPNASVTRAQMASFLYRALGD